MLEWLELKNLPHLIIIDGGKGQLSSALAGIKEWQWKYEKESSARHSDEGRIEDSEISEDRLLRAAQWQIQICSIAKREEEIFIPWEKKSILFEKWSPELMVLQKARDEAHRFSITANRSARMKSMKKNILEELPGFGPITRKNLLKLAWNLDAIKTLSEEQILSVCTKTQLETLRDHGIN